MFSTCKIFDSIHDAKLWHMCEQMMSDVVLVPVYQVLMDSIPGDFCKLVPNGKIQYFHKRQFIKYQPAIQPLLISDETDNTILGFATIDGKLSITYKDVTTNPSTYWYFHPTTEELNQINALIGSRTHEN